jgi:hypothetical protein
VASSQQPKSASTNKQGGGRATTAAVKRCLRDLERAPLADRTKDAYGQHVAAYGAWLARRPDGAKALADPKARDYAGRDFKRHLKVDRGWKPASVNLALAAVDHFNRFLGLGRANVKREPLAQAAPRTLEVACVTNLVRSGNDLVLVAELAGHRWLETTRRCSLPSAADRQAAMDALEIEG